MSADRIARRAGVSGAGPQTLPAIGGKRPSGATQRRMRYWLGSRRAARRAARAAKAGYSEI